MTSMKLFIGSDHGGFPLKEELIAWLTETGLAASEYGIDEVLDLGPSQLNPDDDYPLIAVRVAQAVQAEPDSVGILLCRSGQGVSIVANKVSGIRAALAWNPEVAAASRADDAANILCLPADYLSTEAAIEICDQWFLTELRSGERYRRRLEEITKIEADLRDA